MLCGCSQGTASTTVNKQAAEYDGVSNAPHVTNEMLVADYWIAKAKNADKVLMTQDEISSFNEQTMQTLSDADQMFEIDTLVPSCNGSKLREYILQNKFPEADSPSYVDGKLLGDDYWNVLLDNMDLGAIAQTQTTQRAVCTTYGNLRVWPTDDFVSSDADDVYYDNAQNSTLPLGERLVVTHTSKDGLWYYAITDSTQGWIRTDSVAFCTEEQWNTAQNPSDFIVVTADSMTLEQDLTNPDLSGLKLYMGTVLELVDQNSVPEISSRAAYGNYVVKIPRRDTSGNLVYEQALVPISRDVNRGYLDYSISNVLTQCFKSEGDMYGWGGSFSARDCSQFYLDAYRCFGFRIPRDSSDQALVPGKTVDMSGMDDAQRKSTLDKLSPGSLLYFPGAHVMVYLGKVDGEYYVISSLGSFRPNGDGVSVSARTVMVSTLSVQRSSGKTWLETLTVADTYVK